MKTKKNLDRRDFIGMTVAGSSVLLTQSCRNWGVNQTTPEFDTKKVRVRHNITSTDPVAQRNVEYFKKAVAKMKALSKSDPANKMGWIGQAEIHYKYCGADNKINIHNTGLFLPWHRAYLFFFEEVCRKLLKEANVEHYADFAIPYWDWTKSSYMPDVFWDEDLKTFEPPAEWKIPGWHRIIDPKIPIKEDLQIDNILNTKSFGPIIGVDSFADTHSAIIEIGAHRIIHNIIGGNMAESSAALDPIFWLLHANVDRIWSLWMEKHPGGIPSPNCESKGCGDDCKYPGAISRWLEKIVEGFFDVSGTPVNRQILNLLDIFNLKYLGYGYDDCNPIKWSRCPVVRTTKVSGNSITSQFIGEIAEMNELKTVRVREFIASTAENSKILENLNASINGILQPQISSESSLPSLLLSLEVEKPTNPAISVRVFINIPSDKSELSIDSPSYVATFSFFESTKGSHHHDSMNMDIESRGFIFEITDTILKLSKANNSTIFSLDDATISIFPKFLNDKLPGGTGNIKLLSFALDLAK